MLWAQVGLYENMLFWKEQCTYQFLEPYDSDKKLMQEYEKRKKKMLADARNGIYKILECEKQMRRLYWSNHGFYAYAEYVKSKG